MDNKALLLAAIVLAFPTPAALAQELTDEEILQRFSVQRDAFAAVRTGTGATRGLSIVTVEDMATAPEAGGPDSGPVLAGTDGGDAAIVVDGGEPAPEGGDAGAMVSVAAADSPPSVDPNQVGILPEELQVNVRISFGYDSATLQSDQKPVLDQMCRVMKASDIKLFRIMGHTDSAGPDAYNEKLSLLRAEEVKRRMVEDCGIAPDRLEAMGLGERFLFDKADPKGPENRRVEFQALS